MEPVSNLRAKTLAATPFNSKAVRAGFGRHLMLDLKDCLHAKLNDLELCFATLDQLPEIISMKKISAPHVFRYQADNKADSGITGMVIIAESHISLHTFPLKNYMFVDVFSCKDFDCEAVCRFFEKTFQPKHIHRYEQERGKDFPL